MAARQHAAGIYDGGPFYWHFEDVEKVLEDHGEADEESLIEANLHDIIEGGDTTKNDIRNKFGEKIAEVIYLVSDYKGRNREDRKCQAFYDEIKASVHRLQATKIKVADRIANVRRSIKNGHSMGEKYKQEYIHFRTQLCIVGHITSMWTELDKLMEYGA